MRLPAQVVPPQAGEGSVAASGALASATNVQVAPWSGETAMCVRIVRWSGTAEYAIAPPVASAG